MSSITDFAKNIFNVEESYLPTEARVTGLFIATALLVYSIYWRCSSSARADTTVDWDGLCTLEHLSTRKRLLLDYRGGLPHQANDACKRAMAGAIRAFFHSHGRSLMNPLPTAPRFSMFDSTHVSSGTQSRKNPSGKTRITHQINNEQHIYKLDISVPHGTPRWSDIEKHICDWIGGFRLTAADFTSPYPRALP